MKTGNILVVNDDTDILRQIKRWLKADGYHVTGTCKGQYAVDFCRRRKFDVIILDYHLRRDCTETQTAGDFIPSLKRLQPAIPIILVSASVDQLDPTPLSVTTFLEINPLFWKQISTLVGGYLSGNAKTPVGGAEC